jgi:hypothetical protein
MKVMTSPAVPEFDGLIPVLYIPPRRYTVSPAEALALAVDREQQAAPIRGVSLLAIAQLAVPVGLTQ